MPELTQKESALLERVDAWLAAHRDEYVADLLDWVAIPSVSDASQARAGKPFGEAVHTVLERALERAEELGFSTERHDGYAVSVLFGDGREEIGLASHLDVVPAGENWEFSPYEPFERDGFVIGRGSSDNKGAAVADLYLLRLLRDLDIPLHHAVRVIYGGAEETGMADLAYYAENAPVPKISIVTDGAFPVNFAQKGGLNVDLFLPAGPVLSAFSAGVAKNAVPATAEIELPDAQAEALRDAIALLPAELAATLEVRRGQHPVLAARGQSGHAAFPEGTSNAILLLATALSTPAVAAAAGLEAADVIAATAIASILQTPYGDGAGTAREDDVSGRLTQNGGLVRPVAGGLLLHLDIRYPVTASHTEILAELEGATGEFGGHVAHIDHAAPFYIARDNPIVELLQSSFDTVLGTTSEPYAMGGGTHSRVLPNAITFGPGFGRISGITADGGEPRRPDFIKAENGTPHGPDEFASIENVFAAVRIYVIALTRLDAHLADE